MAEKKKLLFRWRDAISSAEGPPSATTRLVLGFLSFHMNENGGSCFPTIERLARETLLDERTVRRHLKRAMAEGWIERREVGRDRGRQGWRRYEYQAVIPAERAGVDAVAKSGRADSDDQKVRAERPVDVRAERPLSTSCINSQKNISTQQPSTTPPPGPAQMVVGEIPGRDANASLSASAANGHGHLLGVKPAAGNSRSAGHGYQRGDGASQPAGGEEASRWRQASSHPTAARPEGQEDVAGEAEASRQGTLAGSPSAVPKREGAVSKLVYNVQEVFEYWREKSGHVGARLTEQRRKKIAARLRSFSVEELKQAIDGACADPFMRGDNDRGKAYDWPETIFRSDETTERHIEYARRKGAGTGKLEWWEELQKQLVGG